MTEYEKPRKTTLTKVSLLLLLCIFVAMPRKANATVAEFISFLESITSTLKNDIGQVLSDVQRVDAEIANTRQQLVWPTTAISQAKSLTSQMQTGYVPLLQAIRQLPVTSATLPAASNLERVIRSQSTLSMNQADQFYTTVYLGAPMATDAAALERNVIDMDDAVARASLKQTIVSDQDSEQIISLANGLEQRTSSAAPGSAIYLNVEAQLAALQSQAQSLKLLAAQLRVEAGTLAHDNAAIKRRALNAQQLRNGLQNIFTRSK